MADVNSTGCKPRRSGWIRARVVLDRRGPGGEKLEPLAMSGELRRVGEAGGRLREIRELYPAARIDCDLTDAELNRMFSAFEAD